MWRRSPISSGCPKLPPQDSSWAHAFCTYGALPRAAALGALYAIAFGSKEGAVTLPAVIFLLDAARGHLGWRDLPKYLMERWRAYTAMVISAGFLLLVRWEILGTIANPIEPLGTDLLLEVPRIWTIAEVWGNYVRLWILPLDLSSDYAPNVIPVSLGWNTANTTGLLLTIAVLVASLASWRIGKMRKGRDSARVAGFGVVWFMLTISPVANVFFLAGVLLAERTLYLPSVGLAAASGWLVARLARSRPTGAAVLLSTLLTLGAARTWLRNPTWQDNPTWLNTLVGDYPQSGRSQWVLGDAFLDFGQTSEALNSYSLALDLLDSHYQVMTDVSQTFINKEMYGPAEGLLQHAWRRDPSFALAPAMLAQIYSELGQPDRAERFSRLALTIDDRDPLRPHILSWSLAARGQYEAAEAARAKAVASQGMGNYWQAWLTLAYLNANTGDTASARNAFDGALATNLSETARTLVDSVRLSVLGPVTDSTELSNRP